MMKKYAAAMLLLATTLCAVSQKQSQFYIGLKTGIGGGFYMFNSVSSYTVAGPNFYPGQARITSSAAAIPALLELIYQSRKFRIGYQFEYQRITTSSYTTQAYVASIGTSDTVINRPDISQHFFCHNLLLEYQVYDDHKHIRLVPAFTFGYFHGLSDASDPALYAYDFSSLNRNRFKIGLGLNGEFYWGQHALVIAPTYGLVPVQALADASRKGFLHFVGLHVGYRFATMKSSTAPTSKKKRKVRANPEEEGEQ